LKYKGEGSTLVIGRRNIIREYVTMNPGTTGGGMVTRVGDDSLFMAGVHVAHDCTIGDHVIMANNATLAGHVVIGDYAVLGGLCAVHQFVRIGEHAMIGGMSGVERDVIPYGQVMGDRARLCGLNIIGMQRRGFSREDIQGLRAAYQFLFSEDGTFSDRVNDAAERFGGIGPVDDIIDFIRADSSRAICQPKGPNGG
jgi:UDP-N-acetylglucosamine acyltransferase